MYRNIVVPVDGSDHAFKAVELAATVAARDGASLWLLHVVPYAEMPEGMRRWAEIEHVDAPVALYEGAVADNILAEAADRAEKVGVADVHKCTEHGRAAARIVEVARQEHADAIIMGSRGLSDIQGLLMGSVAHKVNHAAKCTVITVK